MIRSTSRICSDTVAIMQKMKRRPMIIELIGPPGVGKTTLAEALLKRDNRIRVDIFPYFRRVQHIPFFVGSFLSLSPTLIHLYRSRNSDWLSRRDIALMTILQGWPRLLGRSGSGSDTIVVLEEGAVCLLAKLQGFGSHLLQTESAGKWWAHMCKQWAETLDLVIRLDTPTPTLVKRIRARGLAHEIDELTDAEAARYIAHIRAAQEHILSFLMAAKNGPRMLCFSTVEATPDQICEQVAAVGLDAADLPAYFSS
jgi:broad-specificity NMP kinase